MQENAAVSWRNDRVLLFTIALAVLSGLLYNVVMMVGFGPDETRHMAYVKLLWDEHKLPFVLPDGSEYAGAHTLHPPLYYLVLVPFYALFHGLPGDGVWHILRAVSLLICVGTLPLIYQIALRVEPQNRNLARLVAAQVGLLPMFGMSAGTINNDSATFLAVVVFLWLLTCKYADDRSVKSAVWLGVCLGAGILCKASALLCDGVALVLYLLAQDGWKALKTPRSWIRLIVVLGVGGLIALPWWLRNMAVYGTPSPLPPPMPNPTGGQLMMLFHPDMPSFFLQANWGIFYTLWSQKDWIPEAVRTAIYIVLALYSCVALIGHIVRWVKGRKSSNQAPSEPANLIPSRIARWTSYGAFAVNWLVVLQGALFLTWGWAEGGRYLLPSLAGGSLFLARGWSTYLCERKLGALLRVWLVAMLALNALCAYWLLSYLNPTFGPQG